MKCQSDKLKNGKSINLLKEKDNLILKELTLRPEGLRVETIQKLTQINLRTLYRRLNFFKEEGWIENIYPIWKIINGQSNFCQSLLKSDNMFELHNLSYVLKLIKVPDWWNKRKRRLIKLKDWQFTNIPFGKGASNPYQQLINENFVIQCYPESLIIIARKRYYSNSPHEAIIKAINDILDLISWFEERMRFKFFPTGIPSLELRNNDFNRLKDHLAETCKKSGKRFLVETEKGKVWIDYSEPFGKEADTPDIQEKLEKVTKDLITKESMLPSEVTGNLTKMTGVMQGLIQNQVMNSENIVKHQKVLDGMLNEQKENNKIRSKTLEVLNKIQEDKQKKSLPRKFWEFLIRR